MNRVKVALLTAIFIATAFFTSCGEHGFLDELLAGNSSSSEEASSSPSQGAFSSSSRGITPSSSSRGTSSVVGSSFSDSRDGKVYKVVEIGGKTWMAENLNYNFSGSKCYGEDDGQVLIMDLLGDDPYYIVTLTASEIQSICAKYGRLYNWDAAMDACPGGWSLPSVSDFGDLLQAVGGEEFAGKHLKTTSGWADYKAYNVGVYSIESGNGQNTYEFAALPSGIGGVINGNLMYFGAEYSIAAWWSSSEYGIYDAYYSDVDHYEGVNWNNRKGDKGDLLSVRCVKD
jgi:uncharacterized protein (TIGR02145 family)